MVEFIFSPIQSNINTFVQAYLHVQFINFFGGKKKD